jgi:hypothetical protein
VLSYVSPYSVVTRLTLGAADLFPAVCGSRIFPFLKLAPGLINETTPLSSIIETGNHDRAMLSSLWDVPKMVNNPSSLGVVVCVNGRHE